MRKLYLDCDGVILDTIDPVYKTIINGGMELNEENVGSYYKSIDWYEFILSVGDIDNAIEKIRKIVSSLKYDVKILTHVHSENELSGKKRFFREVLPDVEVIGVMYNIPKADAVDADGAILVDDYLPNLDYWHSKGGIAIKFSSSDKPCDYFKITDLTELLTSKNLLKEKVKN